MANLDQECKSRGCRGKTLYGDQKLLQLDIERNQWSIIGTLKDARLGYTSAVEVPGYVCDILEYGGEVDIVTSVKTFAWKEDEFDFTTPPDSTVTQFEDPECGSESDFERTTTEEMIIFEKSMTLFAKSSAENLKSNFTDSVLFSIFLFIYVNKTTNNINI